MRRTPDVGRTMTTTTIDREAERPMRRAGRSLGTLRAFALALTATAALLLLPAAGPAFGMTVQEAYDATDGRPHTDIDPKVPGFSHAEAVYLTRLFDLVDLAIIEKTQTWIWFQSEGKKGASFRDSQARVDRLIAELAALETPSRLAEVQRLMVEAVGEQRAFFAAWQEAFDRSERGEDNRQAHQARGRLMQSSSAKLHAAHDQLLALFPAAGRRNLRAFYDHLCVLDLL